VDLDTSPTAICPSCSAHYATAFARIPTELAVAHKASALDRSFRFVGRFVGVSAVAASVATAGVAYTLVSLPVLLFCLIRRSSV
jgi:hypothetical protein